MWFIILLLGIFIFFGYFSIKSYNPYKCILLIGDKGSGKSTYICKQIIKHQKRGWTCYTDAHVRINDVIIFDPQDLKTHTPVPKSLVCIDEGKLAFDNRNYQSWDKGLTEWFVLQRHYYSKVIISSQAVNVDKTIRDLADKIWYIQPIGCVFGLIRPLEKNIIGNDDTHSNDNPLLKGYKFASVFKWRVMFIPRWYKYHDSFAAPKRPYIKGEVLRPLYVVPFAKPPKKYILDCSEFVNSSN